MHKNIGCTLHMQSQDVFFAPIRQLPVVPDADPGFGQRGPQILRLKVGERSALSVAGSFWVFKTKICVLPHSRDSFSLIFTSTSTPKANKY